MNVMLQKRCAKFIYVVPEGLRELMSDISREVIRSQPTHIYTFIADYLDALMITRENARVAARLVDSIIRIGATTVELLEKTGMTRQEADRMASIIQSAFKQYMAARRASLPQATPPQEDFDEEVEEQEPEIVSTIIDQYGEYIENEDAAAEIIQNAFRDFKKRHDREKQLLSGMIDWRVAARSAIYLYRKTGVTYPEANRAATMIKAAYKGYYTRRIMKRLLEEGKMLYGDEYERMEPETVEYEETYEEPSGLEWKEYLDLTHQDEDISEFEGEETPADVAGSILDDMISSVQSESFADDLETTPTTWTEDVGIDETIADEMDATVAYLSKLEGEAYEEDGEEEAIEADAPEQEGPGTVEGVTVDVADTQSQSAEGTSKTALPSPSAPDETATEYTVTESFVTTEATEGDESNV